MNPQFGHENLKVYRDSIQFISSIHELMGTSTMKHTIRDQLERASISIPLNIAEGNGKFTDKDKCKFFDIARGSAMECAACVDILLAKNEIEEIRASQLKSALNEIVRMLVGLIRSTSKTRTY